jgi:4-hydroxy-2-oxoheptanedioate aldolase
MDMPKNAFKAALKAGRHQAGLWCSVPDPGVVEAMAGAGYDWILIDTEHSPAEPTLGLSLLQAAAPYPVSTVVRPVVNDTALIKRWLDIGAQTLMLPYVETPAEAERAVAACRYGPRGVRGVTGLSRATRYSRVTDYLTRAEAEICLLLQVETVRALERLEAIAGVDGVDGVFIGPSDLAASMGLLGQPNHPDVVAACLDGIARLKAMGVPAGILTLDKAVTRQYIAAGTGFTALGVDLALMIGAVEALRAEFS